MAGYVYTMRVSVVILCCFSVATAQDITLTDNGYSGVLVAINDCVNETEYPDLITDLQRVLTQFSSSVYVSTDNRAYVRDVTILVPTSWQDNGYEEPRGETFSSANIIVDTPNTRHGDRPFAFEREPTRECGQQWDGIHLTPDFVTEFRPVPNQARARCIAIDECDDIPGNQEQFQSCRSCTEYVDCRAEVRDYVQCPPGLVYDVDEDPTQCIKKSDTCGAMELVHEWGHFRWGLGDEHPGSEFPPWQKDPAMEGEECRANDRDCYGTTDRVAVIPNSCSQEIVFESPRCSMEQVNSTWERCTYRPARVRDQKDRLGSVMTDVYNFGLPSITRFCGKNPDLEPESTEGDGRTHNRISLNEHNVICREQSAWQVMSKHEDFNNANHLRPSVMTQPNFRFVQQRRDSLRVVLVLDVSGSMTSTRSRGTLLETMNQDAEQYICTVPAGSYVGVTQFASTASVRYPVTRVEGDDCSEASRQALVAALPRSATGGTCIGCGLRLGMQELQRHSGNAAGGRVLLITDGIENVTPTMAQVTPELVTAGVVVDSIQYTDAADERVRDVSEATGGEYFYDAVLPGSTGMVDALLDLILLTNDQCSFNVSVAMMTETTEIPRGDDVTLNTVIDMSVGHGSQFSFTYPPGLSVPFGKAGRSPPAGAQGLGAPMAVTLRAPSGETFLSSDGSMTENNNVIGSLRMRIPGQAEFGRWGIEMRNVHSSQSFSSQVVVTSSPPSPYVQPITARASILGVDVDLSNNPFPVRVFTRVSQGHAPIINADVVATIESSNGEIVHVHLGDDGQGPDVVANDGVYTGMFMEFSRNGRFTVSVDVTNEHDTARLVTGTQTKPEDETRRRRSVETSPVGLFERTSAAGFFTVTNHPTNNGQVPNVIPPARVTDLRFVWASEEERTVELQWTAVGANMYEGIADNYDLRYCPDIDQLTNNFGSCHQVEESSLVHGSLLSPSPANQRETVVFHVTEDQLNRTENYGLRVYDADGLSSDMSNIARVFVPMVLPLITTTIEEETTTVATTTTETPEIPTVATTTTETPSSDPMVRTILIITSVNTLVIAAILSVVIVLSVLVCKRNKVTPTSPAPTPDPALTTSTVGLLMDVESLAGDEMPPKRPPTALSHEVTMETRPASEVSYAWSWQGGKK